MEEPDGLDKNMHSSSQLADVDSSCTEASEANILDISIQNMSSMVSLCLPFYYLVYWVIHIKYFRHRLKSLL